MPRYTRNLVDEGNGRFNLMVLCWGEGHGSAIHDHANAHCIMKILQGELCEVLNEIFYIYIYIFLMNNFFNLIIPIDTICMAYK